MSSIAWQVDVDARCWCGEPPAGGRLGAVVGGEWVPTHICPECPAHCSLEANARRCKFALCAREATSLVERASDVLKVCDVHVMPAARWGTAEPPLHTIVRAIAPDRPAA